MVELDGSLVQIYFRGQPGPQEIVCRHPLTWGWILYSQGTCWTSWPMPPCVPLPALQLARASVYLVPVLPDHAQPFHTRPLHAQPLRAFAPQAPWARHANLQTTNLKMTCQTKSPKKENLTMSRSQNFVPVRIVRYARHAARPCASLVSISAAALVPAPATHHRRPAPS